MPLLFPGGTVITGRRRMFDTPVGQFERTPNAVFGRNGLFGLCAIIMALENEGQRTLMTAYPFPISGVRHVVTINGIKEDCLGLEGWIDADTEDGFPITFFASDYFINSHRYEVGATLAMTLGGLAYDAGPPPESKIEITDPEVIAKYRAAGMIDVDRAAMLLPIEEWEPFDYSFQGQIKTIATDSSGKHQQAQLSVMLMDDKAFDLRVLCTRSRMTLPPVGEFVAGRTCVMGHLADFEWPDHGVG
jgi:hypothetical protein